LTYQIEFTQSASEMLKAIRDRRIRQKIAERISGLATDPEKQGKELAAELDGYRSLRAAGQRYRIIYRIDGDKVIVVVVAVGIRKEGDKKDIYTLAKKLFRARLLEPEEDEEPKEKAP
jgi:mRNA interferase RelE/StbE